MKVDFEIGKFSVLLLTPAPIDVTSGLVLDKTIIIRKQSPLIYTKVGLGGEVLISEGFSRLTLIELTYLPNAEANKVLEGLVTLGAQFGISISNNSKPKWKALASECRVEKRPDVEITSKNAFQDLTWSIVATDFIQKFI
ncbi:MAG: hypothetical protein N3A69_17870 [Leptospiraceae bacterium]|nr:hypothetical protein [Leptospiraceae bacterium]